MTTRRGFLASLAATASLPGLTWADAGSPAYLAAARAPDGAFALFGLTAEGRQSFRIPLPSRGHAAAGHPVRPEAVAFARRPGTYALVIECAQGAVMHRLTAPEGHHFSGHGVFSRDGQTLFTAEIETATGAGRVGLWSAEQGYARAGQVASGGIGPHEIIRLPGSDTLVVANGGIMTAPDDGRTKLNLDTMRPNLSYLTGDGALLAQVELDADLHKNSIRHLAVHADGMVAFAMQWQGAEGMTPPLLGLHRIGEAPILCEAPELLAYRMKGYAGSVAFSGAGDRVAITCPRGGLVALFGKAGGFVGAVERADVCGIGPMGAGFLATDGMGGVNAVQGLNLRPLQVFERAWDNHLVRI